MSTELKADIRPAVYFHKAIKLWIITAAISLPTLSSFTYFFELNSSFLAIACSVVSFICCTSAGASAQRARGGGALYTGMLIGVTITVVLLTFGFAIKGTEMESAGVLSVSTFSITGALFGAVFLGGIGEKRTKKDPRKRQLKN